MVTERVTYAYDALGRQQTVTQDRDGDLGTTADQDVTSYTYDAVTGGVASVTNPQGTVNYEYDEATGRLERTYTDGSGGTDTRYTYDQLGRLKTVGVYERNNVPLSTPETTTYGYDLVGNLDWTHHDWNDVVADYQYDALNRLELLEHFIDEDGDKRFDELDEKLPARFAYEVGLDGARKLVTETDD